MYRCFVVHLVEIKLLLNCLRSATERFLFPVLKRGINYRKKSPLRHLYLTSNVTSRHSYSGNLFPDIIADWHSSGPCGNLNYLGHSKKFCLIDWLIWRTWINNQRISMASTPIIKHSCSVLSCQLPDNAYELCRQYQQQLRQQVQAKFYHRKNTWWENLTHELQAAADRQDMTTWREFMVHRLCTMHQSAAKTVSKSAPVSPICCSAEQNISTPWLISCQALTFQRFASFGSGQFQKVSQSLIQSVR